MKGTNVNSREFDQTYFEGKNNSRGEIYDTPLIKELASRYFTAIEREVAVEPGMRVLDIGCAYGDFLSLCDSRNLETYGFDISEHAISKATTRTRAQLTVGNANEELPYSDSEFSIITMFDVIEHLVSPYQTLSEVQRVMDSSGTVVITTPNTSSAERLVLRDKWSGARDLTHNYLFSRYSLVFLLERAGFQPLLLTTPFPTMPLLISKMLERTGLGGQLFCVAQLHDRSQPRRS